MTSLTRSLADEPVAVGDVLWYWFDTGAMGASMVFVKVIRVNRVTFTVENEWGDRWRSEPHKFDGKVKPGEWSPWNKDGR